MPPRTGDVWTVKGYHYPMIITEVINGRTLVLAPATEMPDGWTAYGMLRLHLSIWSEDLQSRILEV